MNELIVFAKAPRVGAVKTRLAADIGPEEACEAYKSLLSILGLKLRDVSNVTVQFSPPEGGCELQEFFPETWRFRPQAAGNLGDRMWSALREALERGSSRPVIIGTDCPYLTRDDLNEAWLALASNDVVFGPAEDGGYWLIGARKLPETLFANIDWSTSLVLEQNLRRCRELNLTAYLLRTLSDVDTLADWQRFQAFSGEACRQASPFP